MDFKLPEIGEGVEEGELVAWKVNVGDSVKKDQVILEVLTDKATVEIASPADGKIASLVAKPGDMLKVGGTCAVIDTGGKSETVSAPAKAPPKSESPKTSPAPTNGHGGGMEVIATSSAGLINKTDVRAFPATRKIANELGVDLKNVQGSGPEGRILKLDVENFLKSGSKSTFKQPMHVSQQDEIIPLRGIRKVITESMRTSVDNAAHFGYMDEVNVTKLVEMRKSLKPYAESLGIKISFLPFFVKAVVHCLKKFPYFNASLDVANKQIILKKSYNIGIACDTPDGLVVPVIKNADQKTLLEISEEIVHLAEAARNKKLPGEAFKDGTFTITSIGSIGGLIAMPIINYPEVAILCINKIVQKPVVENGQIVIRDMLNLSMSIDHRIIDGATGARFVNELIAYLSDPGRMMLEMK